MSGGEPKPSGLPPQGPGAQSAVDIEREQEAKLAKKYGGLAKRKIMPKDHAYFDSADWALSKQGVKPADSAGGQVGQATTALPPRLAPQAPEELRPRRSSHLGETSSLGSSLGLPNDSGS